MKPNRSIPSATVVPVLIYPDVREAVAWRARQAHIPPQEHVTVQLHYAPGDARRRDAPNLVATSKPAVDAAPS